MAKDVGMVWMCCGVVPILFGWFLRVLSPRPLVFIQKTFLWLQYFCVCVLPNTINDRDKPKARWEDTRYGAFTRRKNTNVRIWGLKKGEGVCSKGAFAHRGRIFGNLRYMNASATVYNECISRKKRSIHQLNIRTGTAQNCSESFIATFQWGCNHLHQARIYRNDTR